jgi:IclR family pca regulon transcriptional regulator
MQEAEDRIDEEEGRPKEFVGSLVHGLKVLTAFEGGHPRMTLSEVAEATGMTRAGARRYLLTLHHLGYVAKTGRQFRLTPKVLELGYAYLASTPLPGLAQPFLDELTAQIGQSSALAVRDGAEAVYVAQSTADRVLAVRVPVGRRLPLLYTSTGRMILSGCPQDQIDAFLETHPLTPFTERSIRDVDALSKELKRIRKLDYCMLDQEVEMGVRTLAVPIRNREDEIEAAAIILTDIGTVDEKTLIDSYLPHLRAAAEEIQRSLRALPASAAKVRSLELA